MIYLFIYLFIMITVSKEPHMREFSLRLQYYVMCTPCSPIIYSENRGI